MRAETLERSCVVLAFAVVVVLFSMTPIADYDFWWHLKLGETVLHTGTPAIADTFSYTFRGQPQFNAEWLGDLAYYAAYRVGGFTGVNLLKAAAVAGVLLLLYRTFCLRSRGDGTRWLAAVLTLLLVLFAIRFRLYPRPALFSYLFLSGFLYLLTRYQLRREAGLLAGLPLLELVWANTSKGAFLGGVVVGIFLLGDLLHGRRDARLLLAALVVPVVSLVNPDGWTVYQSLLGVLSGGDSVIWKEVGEHQPVSGQLLWGYGLRYTWPFQVLGLLALGRLGLLRGLKPAHQPLLFLAFLIPAAYSIRLTAFFAIACSALAFEAIEQGLARLPGALSSRRRWQPVLAGALLVATAVSAFQDDTYPLGSGPKRSSLPEGAVRFLEAHGVSGAMFNSYPFGGYLIWRAPDRGVFVDGRAGQLYSQRFLEEYQTIVRDPAAWRAAEEAWGFSYAVVEYDLRSGNRHFPMHLNDDPSWALVYWDPQSAVYLKESEPNRHVIDQQRYELLRPNGYDLAYVLSLGHGPRALSEVLVQVDREIGFNPDNQEPRLAKVLLLHSFGGEEGREAAFRELLQCLELSPDLAMEHSAMAFMLHQRGRSEEARRELAIALAKDPHDPMAMQMSSVLGP